MSRRKLSLVTALALVALVAMPTLFSPSPVAQAAESEPAEPAESEEDEPFPEGKREFLRSDHLMISQLAVRGDGPARSRNARYDTHGPRFSVPPANTEGPISLGGDAELPGDYVAEVKPAQVAGRFDNPRQETVLTARRTRSASKGDQFVIEDATAAYTNAATRQVQGVVLPIVPLGNKYAPQGAQPAMASGDLDGAGDEEGLARDELVIVTQVEGRALEITVTDFGLVQEATDRPLTTTVKLGAGTLGTSAKPSSVAATIGDFDADGQTELAVIYETNNGQKLYQLVMYRYSHGAPTNTNALGPGKLTVVREPTAMLEYSAYSADVPLSAQEGITSFEAASADVLGEGRPQLIVSQIIMKGSAPQTMISAVSFGPEFDIVDAGFGSYGAYTTTASALRDRLKDWQLRSDFRPSLATGMLRLDPARGFGPDRRGIVSAFPSAAGDPQVLTLRADKQKPFDCGQQDGTPKCTILFSNGSAGTGTLTRERFAGVTPFPVMSATVGGLAGIGPELTPDSVAVAISGSTATKLHPTLGRILDPDKFVGGVAMAQFNGDGSNLQNFTLQPLSDAPAVVTAYDAFGESLVLGTPTTITLNSAPIFEAMIQEPPKHLDYLPEEEKFENVSRLPSVFLETSSEKSTKYSYVTKNRSDWGMGGSIAVGAKGSATVGVPLIGSAKLTVEAEVGFGVNYESERTGTEEQAGSHTVESKGATNDDDLVSGSYLNATVYRYPVLGQSVSEPLAAGAEPVFEVIVPGTRRNFVDQGFDGGRDMGSLYQPVHENGNALSYPDAPLAVDPQTKVETVSPPADDIGGYFDPLLVAACEQRNTDRRTDPVNPRVSKDCRTTGDKPGTLDLRRKAAILKGFYAMSANDNGVTIKETFESATKIDRDSTITFKENLDAKVTLSGKTGDKKLSNDVKAKAWIEAAYDSDQVVGNSRALDMSVESANGMDLKLGNIDPSKAYRAGLVYYYDKANRQVVRQYVDFKTPTQGVGDANKWWNQTYAAPDPALNMPYRMELGRNVNTSNQVASLPQFTNNWGHQALRGFWMVHPSAGDTLPGEPLAFIPTTGDQVGLRVRVYNYSLGSRAENVKVRFEAVSYNKTTGAPQGGPKAVGETFVSLDPREMKEVEVPWDTTTFGPTSGTTANYRMFVTLDPAEADKPLGAIEETHELLDRFDNPATVGGARIKDPKTGKAETLEAGQNNQGYGIVAVAAKGAAQAPVGQTLRVNGADKSIVLAAGSPTNEAVSTDVHLDKNAMAIAPDTSPEFDTSSPYARRDRHQTVRVTVRSDDVHHAFHYLTLYEGDPANGGEAVAHEMVHGVSTEGSTVFVDWVPTKTGSQELHAVVHEPGDDTELGNATAVLKVDVGTTAKPASSRDGMSGVAVGAVAALLVGLLAIGVIVMRRRPGSVT